MSGCVTIITLPPQKEANDTYRTFGMVCPDSIQISDGRLASQKRPEELTLQDQPVKRGRGRPKGSKNKKTLEQEHLEKENL